MVWDEDRQNRGLFRFYQAVIALRKRHPALRSMDIRFLHAEAKDAVVVYERSCGANGERFIVALNAGARARKLAVPAAEGTWRNASTGDAAEAKAGMLTLTLEGFGFAVLQEEK